MEFLGNILSWQSVPLKSSYKPVIHTTLVFLHILYLKKKTFFSQIVKEKYFFGKMVQMNCLPYIKIVAQINIVRQRELIQLVNKNYCTFLFRLTTCSDPSRLHRKWFTRNVDQVHLLHLTLCRVIWLITAQLNFIIFLTYCKIINNVILHLFRVMCFLNV